VHHERYRKKLEEDRAFEGKLCRFGLDSKTYRIYNQSNGTVVESRNVTFIETPARTIPYQFSNEDNGYESDVLSFTSLLGTDTPADDFNGPNTNGLDYPTQT